MKPLTELLYNSDDRAMPSVSKPVVLIIAMAAAIGADLAADSLAHFTSPGLFLLPTIAVVGIFAGLNYSLAAAGISIIFVAVRYAQHATMFQPPWDPLIRLSMLAVAAPVIAIIVGYQHRRIEEIASGRVNQALRARAADLADLAAALKLSNDELDQFTYVTSHDLKAPLRGISNLAQWIEEDLGERITPVTHEQLNLLRGRVHRMESLINGLLEYAHVGRTQGKIEAVDIAALLVEVVDWIGPPPEVRIQIDPGMPVFDTDRLRLQQVFTNLIQNAVKHRGKPGVQIGVGCKTTGRFYEFSVRDDGQGIEPQYHQRIFGIFQTLLPRDQMEGTGIGLALVKKVVESKGGKVTVESVPGRGAKFCFTWPRPEGKQS